MRIATFNINGITSRLPALLEWLQETKPDVVCLQELKAPDARFPAAALEAAGFGCLWRGQERWNGVAILARDAEPNQVLTALPGEPDDMQARYLEAAVNGVIIAGLYLPNGNPAPGPKFDYKLRWFERLQARAQTLLDHEVPVVIAGDFNVMPTDLDVYVPERWRDDALFRPEVRQAYANLVDQGWTDALRHLHPGERIYTFWKYLRQAFERDAGLRIDHLLLSPQLAPRLQKAGVDRLCGRDLSRATMRRCGSRSTGPEQVAAGSIYRLSPLWLRIRHLTSGHPADLQSSVQCSRLAPNEVRSRPSSGAPAG